jgi:hypothetical protein
LRRKGVSAGQITSAIVLIVLLIAFASLPTRAIPGGWKWILIVAVAVAGIYVIALDDDTSLPSDCEPGFRAGCR